MWKLNLQCSWQSCQRIRSGFGYSCFFFGSGYSFIRICGSEFEFGSAPPKKSALYTAKTLLSLPQFFFFGLHLNFGRKNAPILSEELFFVYFWFSLLRSKCTCLLVDPQRISSCWIPNGSGFLNLWIRTPLVCGEEQLAI